MLSATCDWFCTDGSHIIVGRKRKMKWSQQDNLRLMSVNPSLQRDGNDYGTLGRSLNGESV